MLLLCILAAAIAAPANKLSKLEPKPILEEEIGLIAAAPFPPFLLYLLLLS